MPREKIKWKAEYIEVTYSEAHWRLLRELRREAIRLVQALSRRGLRGVVYGSIARGDVHRDSDIDIMILYPVPSAIIELALEEMGYRVSHKLIVQATPGSTPKAYLFLDEKERRSVSYPLAYLQGREYEFYRFGGLLDWEGLSRGERVPGVTKALVLIEPTPKGHRESPVIGRESEVARVLGISAETVLERVRVLSRRDVVGRTGVFIKVILGPGDSIEEAAMALASRNPYFRKALRSRGSPLL